MERKIIYTDFDGVVGKFDLASILKQFSGLDRIRVLKMHVHMIGILKQSKQFKKLINEYQAGKYNQDKLIELIGTTYPSLSSIARDVLNMLPNTLVVNQDMLDYLDKKLAEDYEIYVITNNMPENISVIQNIMNGHCNGIFYSTELGKRKDNPETFKHINKTLNAKPEDVKMFLDDKLKYVKVARACGLPAMAFNDKDKKMYGKIDNVLKKVPYQIEK